MKNMLINLNWVTQLHFSFKITKNCLKSKGICKTIINVFLNNILKQKINRTKSSLFTIEVLHLQVLRLNLY